MKKKWTKEKKQKFIVTVLIIGTLILCYLIIPSFRQSINKITVLLASADIESLKDYILSFGLWAPAISMFLMMFQSIAAPLPAFVITFANAWVFGWVQGAFYSWTGAMLGAILCFYISKLLGRPVAEKLVTARALNKMDSFFEAYGNYTILICRLVPFISFDVVSYAAGLTEMSLLSFLVATGIGQLPATLVYSFVGGSLGKETTVMLYGILGFCLLVVMSLVLKKIILNKKQQREAATGYDKLQ